MGVFHTIWKSIVAGAVYVLSTMLAGMILLVTGLKMPEPRGDMHYFFAVLFTAGLVSAIFLGPLVKSLRLSFGKSFAILFGILYLNAASVAAEGAFFAGGTISKDVLPAILLQQLIVSFFSALAVALLFRPKKKESIVFIYRGGWFQWIWRLLLASAGYVVIYYVLGSVTYQLFTETYYKAGMGGLSVPSVMEILKLEPVRGLMMVLSVLPLILFSDWPRIEKGLLAGGVLFLTGGVVPLLLQMGMMPLKLLGVSAFEIFLQNLLTGIAAVYLFCPGYSENRTYYV